jgi:hypothetical protein
MPVANEDDVVAAFRQAVEEELRKVQAGHPRQREDIFAGGASGDDALRRLLHRHEELEHEVALLRTIVLKLVSDPVDRNLEPPTD